MPRLKTVEGCHLSELYFRQRNRLNSHTYTVKGSDARYLNHMIRLALTEEAVDIDY